ncbi:MAG TPA: ATP-binding protein [bacterium]|nr:ATP-binding protein [bacterium]
MMEAVGNQLHTVDNLSSLAKPGTQIESISRRLLELMALEEIGQAVVSIYDLNVVLPLVLSTALAELQAETGSIMLLDPETGQLRIAAAVGLEEYVGKREEKNAGGGISRYVLDKGEPLLIEDIDRSVFRKVNDQKRYTTRSLISVPINVHEEPLGVINVTNKKGQGTFTQEDLKILQIVAYQAALAIKNSRLSGQVEVIGKKFAAAEKLSLAGQFAAGIAHEIGTPLNVIRGRAQFLLMRLPSDVSFRQDLELIVEESDRISRLVYQFLDLCRPAPGEKKRVSVNEILDHVFVLLRHKIPEPKYTVQKDLAPDLPCFGGDPGQLQQLFLNLLANAVEAMENGGILHVATRLHPLPGRSAPGDHGSSLDFLEISISDTGNGMGPEDLKKIFTPFFTTKPSGKGTGLGLAVCQRIVEEHGGLIEVSSEPGCGSTFTVKFPVYLQEKSSVPS